METAGLYFFVKDRETRYARSPRSTRDEAMAAVIMVIVIYNN